MKKLCLPGDFISSPPLARNLFGPGGRNWEDETWRTESLRTWEEITEDLEAQFRLRTSRKKFAGNPHFGPPGACDLEEEIGNMSTCDLEDESRNLEEENTSDLEDEIGSRNHLGPGGRIRAPFGLRTWRTTLEEEIT